MPRDELLTLDPEAGTGQIWFRISDLTDEQNAEVIDKITELATQAVPPVDVSGLISVRLATDSILDALLLVVSGSRDRRGHRADRGGQQPVLSVIERRPENGLMPDLLETLCDAARAARWPLEPT